MNENDSLIKNLKQACSVEKKMGYKNAAVFGGFSAFANKVLNRLWEDRYIKTSVLDAAVLQETITSLQNYPGHLNRERELIVTAIQSVIDQFLKGKTEKQPTKTGTDAKLNNCQPVQLQFLKNVGPKRIKLLNRLGINTIEDLLYHFPRKYEDRTVLKKFHQLLNGEIETVAGSVVSCQEQRPRKKLVITKAAIFDGLSSGYGVWFNQPFIKKQLTPGAEIILTGKVERKFGAVQITVSDYEIMDKDDPLHSGRIVPFYPATEGLPPRVLRSIIKNAVDGYLTTQDEFLPAYLLEKYGLIGLSAALNGIHFPDKMTDIDAARKRLVFEELFLLQLGVGLIKSEVVKEPGIKHKKAGSLSQRFFSSLPFAFTQAQQRVLNEIVSDMQSVKTMNRLVEGDVGSGKTVIAAAALIKTVESGYQGVMMAPTEILAVQHFEGLVEIFGQLGVQTALLTGSLSKKDKKKILEDIKEGRIDVLVGTHAVIQEEVVFQRLGLAITDEQHRFGVKQRAKLKEKGANPDILVMTATPIPRTLALTVYGDLDISVIDQLPPGRQVIKTYWISNKMKDRVYNFIKTQVNEGRQVYYICPLVEESEKIDVAAAAALAEMLQNNVFPDYKIGLMHGRLKQEEKDRVMREFKEGNVNVLVATTVVEVGVNISNAALIVIEDADRFGLAQLHQLRGRVGRGRYQSYCVLVADPSTEEGRARMNIMQATSDGFIIAEEDLKIRGPGEFFGTRQSGLPDLKIADLIKDVKILKTARDEAGRLLSENPGLTRPEYAPLKLRVLKKFKEVENYIEIS